MIDFVLQVYMLIIVTVLPLFYRDTKNGQQCCYAEDGLLIADPPGAGTVLRTNILINAHYGYFENDYFSYLVCCQEDQNSDRCKGYYEKRPIPPVDC